MDIEEGYNFYLEKIVPKIKVPISFERFRHLVYEGKIDLSKLKKSSVDPNCEFDGAAGIAEALGISEAKYRRLKKKYPDSRSKGADKTDLHFNHDHLHEGGRDIMVPDSGHWFINEYDKRVKETKVNNLKGHITLGPDFKITIEK
jgi:hypothetical protein